MLNIAFLSLFQAYWKYMDIGEYKMDENLNSGTANFMSLYGIRLNA